MRTMKKDYPNSLKYSEVWPFFESGGLAHIATIEGDQPRVRVMALTAFDNSLWLVARTSDDKIEQIRNNSKVEFTYIVPGKERTGCLRVTATAAIVTNDKTRLAVANAIPWFEGYWKSGEDPDYTLIRLVPNKILFDHHESASKYTIEF